MKPDTKPLELFDAHFHIIDPRFPLIPNNGYIPPAFTCEDYLRRVQNYPLRGGAIVSGSFQGFDQSYLKAALHQLGPGYVGVAQLPVNVSDAEVLELNQAGVRAIRFNIKRGGSEQLSVLDRMARRVYELAGWHAELYVDAAQIEPLIPRLLSLPAMSIDHLGLSAASLPSLIKLVEQGVKVKATGFGRVDFDVASALKQICAANSEALMFGTDLPSTRAPIAYQDADYDLVIETLGESAATDVFYNNAVAFYRLHEF